ncbi:PREDICTED: DNA/RNA-binding protein KIN17 [Rhagoletis zephyria]|uniref:DNA/RNA-binding protein KIN17 n=1 Tax=Rhagoletis zephyria TaxID=28612 RepID=UPI000811427B|nr:PREDICTED: DNA/RNA-binding protein KIN17 [Rhagoletis zephyria]
MGRAEVGTPKYLANKMKAKGLQKLRWYCQMCEKQCRDENGFKCHTMSESHQRQLLLFADSPGKFLHSFSKEFSDGYMELLRRRFGTKRVNANKVYQEYISVKDHIHMNATRWLTLSDYVKWLGRTGQVVADETEKGWYVTYIDRSPDALERQAKAEKKEKMEKDDEERMMEFIEKQIEKNKAKEGAQTDEAEKYTELKRDEEQPLKLDIRLERKFNPDTKLGPSALILKRPKLETRDEENSAEDDDSEVEEKVFKKPKAPKVNKLKESHRNGKKSALDELIKEEEAKKERANRKDYWLHTGIVVKFIDKAMGEKFYKQKAVVQEVIEKYRAKIKFLDTGDKLKVDQAHLETVIPALDKPILVLNGAYRGCEAILKSLDERNYCVTIEIARGPLKGRVVDKVQYEDISKIY